MALTTIHKAEIVKKFQQSKLDTGSPEVQVALLTTRIRQLTDHLRVHKKDFHTRYGLTNMTSLRSRLLRYLKKQDMQRYSALIKTLEIRG
ncbi:MAG: 30S ribosomal protein S15 [Gammaproteobacteria bacterium RIFCSPHIGHO2_12_FULL_42_10]|nr:MAG: 30S ribosomal protein S15 [Gammaproteobacteria bacterium RIFCSPHIGHO2_12_FULL_42_10]